MDSTQTSSGVKNIKVCRVCGERAFSFHFNAITCSSCKMFFKRNAFKGEKLKCFSSQECCPINSQTTRKACSKCRLLKCFAIGMTTDNLQQQQQTQISCSKKRKKLSLLGENSRTNILTNEKPLSIVNSILNETILCQYKESELEKANDKLKDGQTDDDTQNYQKRKNGRKLAVSVLANRKAEVVHCEMSNTVKLSPRENSLIEEAKAASASCFIDESSLPVVGQIGSLVEAFNAYSHYVRRIVGYCNRVEAFKAIKRADQLALLKPFYFELLAIRFSYLYNAQIDGYPVIENEDGTRAVLMRIGLINDCQKYHLTEIHRKYKSSLHEMMEGDPTIRDLIMIQFLFRNSSSSLSATETVPVISCLEFVRKQYFLYCYLLLRYLQTKYGSVSTGTKKYASLMALLEEFSRYHYVREIFDAIEDTSAVSSDILAEIFSVN